MFFYCVTLFDEYRNQRTRKIFEMELNITNEFVSKVNLKKLSNIIPKNIFFKMSEILKKTG